MRQSNLHVYDISPSVIRFAVEGFINVEGAFARRCYVVDRAVVIPENPGLGISVKETGHLPLTN